MGRRPADPRAKRLAVSRGLHDALVADTTIGLGGPLDDGTSFLHLVNAADEASVRRCLGRDPWHRDGLLRIAWVKPWQLWLDGRT